MGQTFGRWKRLGQRMQSDQPARHITQDGDPSARQKGAIKMQRTVTAKEIEESPYGGMFGYCQRCWKEDGVLNNDGDLPFGPDTYFACNKHKTMWCVGVNVTRGWMRKPEEELDRIAKQYRENYRVEPPLFIGEARSMDRPWFRQKNP
jgi:hypothetical protein